MIIDFRYGFPHGNFVFGWHKKELYRLPSESNNRYYPLRKLSPIRIGNQAGYRCHRDKLSIGQLKTLTVFINQKISTIQDKNCPF